ncbi:MULTISPECIES: hypothetical protein [unclassified Pantoea]|uniref:hypothetical protein n=1 Tax=unclassified Pantoea TaxID=2630326 RepID=UPI002B49131D|nr:hypothetical protein [Pantoea sp. JZ29]
MKRELTIAGLMADLARFAPDTPCVAHLWVADDFEDIDSDLTPDEITAAIELADGTFDADLSLSWAFMRECAEHIRARREEE